MWAGEFFSALVTNALRIHRLWEGKCHFINFAILIYKINIYVGKLKEKIQDLISAFLERGVRDMYDKKCYFSSINKAVYN